MVRSRAMNAHLAPVFESMMPVLTSDALRYWVYGGVGVAGVAGKFIRTNTDVDISCLTLTSTASDACW